MLEVESSAGDRQQGAGDVPEHGADVGQALQVGLGLERLDLGRGGPGQVARVEVRGVLLQRQGHGVSNRLRGKGHKLPFPHPSKSGACIQARGASTLTPRGQTTYKKARTRRRTTNQTRVESPPIRTEKHALARNPSMQPDAGLPPDPEKQSPPLDGAGAAGPSTAAAGLPPVAPPSGKFILQL